MCLFPQLITNARYKPNKKNGGVIPHLDDIRKLKVPIGCQKCMECRKQKARDWQVRLAEDIKTNTNGKFVTFTFSEKYLSELRTKIHYKYEGYDIDNAIATYAVRKFTERYRRWARIHNEKPENSNNQVTKSLRHWLVTELGQTNTERLHIHGIIWTDIPKKQIENIWKYGNMGWQMTWAEERNYVDQSSISYIVKYLSKSDKKHPNYKSIVLTSNGIGDKYKATENKFNGTETKEFYRLPNGTKIALPIYYRNKIYTDEQKEQLWIQKIDKEERYVCGERVDISKTLNGYEQLLKFYQVKNNKLGYGNNIKNWKKAAYEKQLRDIKHQTHSKKNEEVCKQKEKSNRIQRATYVGM